MWTRYASPQYESGFEKLLTVTHFVGSWTFSEFGAQLPKLLGAIVDFQLKAEFSVKKLEDVENWWDETDKLRVLVKP